MKRYIRSSTTESYPGFYFVAGNRGIFLESNMSNVTDRIIRQFINKVCDIRNVGNAIRQASLYDERALADFRRRIDRAVLEHIDTGRISYWIIRGKGFQESFPEDDFERDVIVIGS